LRPRNYKRLLWDLVAKSETKEMIAIRICNRLGVRAPGFSIGSTEPKELFTLICDSIGLAPSASASKPQMASFIVESAGEPWLPSFESAGGTVTREGLLAVEKAVNFFIK
jgi:hypothetical protein